jgi:hypothetical protein
MGPVAADVLPALEALLATRSDDAVLKGTIDAIRPR